MRERIAKWKEGKKRVKMKENGGSEEERSERGDKKNKR